MILIPTLQAFPGINDINLNPACAMFNRPRGFLPTRPRDDGFQVECLISWSVWLRWRWLMAAKYKLYSCITSLTSFAGVYFFIFILDTFQQSTICLRQDKHAQKLTRKCSPDCSLSLCVDNVLITRDASRHYIFIDKSLFFSFILAWAEFGAKLTGPI